MPRPRTTDWGPEPHVARIQKRMARGETLEEAAEGLHIPFWLAKAVFVRSGLPVPMPLRRRSLPNAAAQKAHQETAALLALRLFSHELGAVSMARGPVPITMKAWDQHRDPKQHPRASQLATRYGTWAAACDAAGVPQRKRRGSRTG
ncbi:MAG: hypothetical protein M3P04_10325 [Actinomycetota bacterium]|nr:hypothetical protein [Actinomycetota bacterium]